MRASICALDPTILSFEKAAIASESQRRGYKGRYWWFCAGPLSTQLINAANHFLPSVALHLSNYPIHGCFNMRQALDEKHMLSHSVMPLLVVLKYYFNARLAMRRVYQACARS